MTSINTYDIGDLVRCQGIFTDAASTVTDPAAITFKVKNPSGTTTTYVYGTDAQLVKDSTGTYYVDVSINSAGVWYYRFASTGSGQAAGENYFRARSTYF